MNRTVTTLLGLCLVFAAARADSLNVRKIGGLDTPAGQYGICLSGNYAYIGVYSGLRVIDISNPSSPVETGYWTSPDWTRGVDVAGNHVFVACGYAGLRVIDVSNPNVPAEVGSCGLPDYAWDVCVVGSHALVATEDAGLYIVDVSNPAAPVIVGSCDTPGSAKNVVVNGDHAYVADLNSGLRVINIANRQSPVEVGHHTMPEASYGIAYADSHVYMGNNGMLRIVNVSNPASPYEVGSLVRAGAAEGLAISGRLLYLGQVNAGMRVVDVADPTAPAEVGFYYEQSPFHLVVSGRYVYCASTAGLRIYEYYGPGAVEEGRQPDAALRAPTATLVRGVLRLPRMTNDQFPMTMLDASGRKVMELQPGENDVSWLTPGIYFVRSSAVSRERPTAARVVIAR